MTRCGEEHEPEASVTREPSTEDLGRHGEHDSLEHHRRYVEAMFLTPPWQPGGWSNATLGTAGEGQGGDHAGR